MTPVRPRIGVFATVDGREYEANDRPLDGTISLVSRGEANPDPRLFAWNDVHQAWVGTVSVGRCERLVEVVTNAGYMGEECRIVAIDESGSVGLYHLGGDKASAERLGFVEISVGTWAKTVNIFDIDKYTFAECHYDLLFEEWARSKQSESN
jgi:hypothetical protein